MTKKSTETKTGNDRHPQETRDKNLLDLDTTVVEAKHLATKIRKAHWLQDPARLVNFF